MRSLRGLHRHLDGQLRQRHQRLGLWLGRQLLRFVLGHDAVLLESAVHGRSAADVFGVELRGLLRLDDGPVHSARSAVGDAVWAGHQRSGVCLVLVHLRHVDWPVLGWLPGA